MAEEVPRLIANRYELHEAIGQGGMGTVYRAVDTKSDTTVAIKNLKSDVATPEIIARFRLEGEALRQLDHPNIVKMLDAIEENEQHYLIMELVEGGSLRENLKKTPQMPLTQMLMIALDVCDALTRSHRLDIVHRDIKPANVLIASDGTPRLTDFGIAHSHGSDMTGSGVIMGTFAYLSPELLQNDDVTKLSDIWALGVMFFEMLAGDKPFEGKQSAALVAAIIGQPVPDLEAIRPDAPIALIDLIYRMLAKSPAERIPSVRLVGAEIEAIMQGRVDETAPEATIPDSRVHVDDPTLIVGSRFATPTPQDVRQKHNLPAQVTPFVGRSKEIQAIAQQIKNPNIRFVTILGPGGMGKTRLALEAARLQIDSFENGVYFVDLAPLETHEDVPVAIAEAVNYLFQPTGGSRQNQILDYFREKEQLIIMDNFEHVLEGAGFVTDILQAAPNVQIMVTSRHKLNQSGEHVFNLEGLQKEDEAVQLFLQSARRIQPDFELSDENIGTIENICALVGGLPLGILLAASWLGMLTPAEILAEIQQGIDILEAEMTDIPERHRSIRAVFDYSHNLLTDAEKGAFYKLSVFRGGFTREAALAVAGANLRTLMSLHNKSLIQRNQRTGRYAIHELLRQYSEEHLLSSGDSDSAHDTHAEYFMQFLADREEDIKGRRQLEGLNEIQAELGNIRVAWDWAIEQRHEKGIGLGLESLKLFCELRGRTQDHIEFMGSVRRNLPQEIGGQPNPVWRRAVVREFPLFSHNPEEIPLYEECLTQAEAFGDARELAYTLLALGDISAAARDLPNAMGYFQKSTEAYEELNDKFFLARLMNRLALSYGFMRDLDKYNEFGTKSYDLATAIGNQIDAAWALHSMGVCHYFRGEWHEGIHRYEAAHAIWTQMGHLHGLAASAGIVGTASAFLGDIEKGRRMAQQAYQIASDMNDSVPLGLSLIALAWLECYRDEFAIAKPMSLRAQQLVAPHPTFPMGASATVCLVACGLGDYNLAYKNLTASLQHMLGIGAVSYITVILVQASFLLTERDEIERAVELLGLYATHPMSGKGYLVADWPFVNRLQNKLQNELGEEAYDAAWERGKSLDLMETGKWILAEFDKET